MRLYLFEDNETTLDNMRDAARKNGLEVLSASTLQTALDLIGEIKDDDIVSLDAQIPNPDDGIKIAEAIRKSDRKCLVLWHSTLGIPDAERLGIYICSLPSHEWITRIGGYNVEWENKKDGYKYYEKKSFTHLIALSILCQGYLAAHGEKRFKIFDNHLKQKAKENKGNTELRSWWEPALKDIINGTGIKDSEILAELEMTGRNYGIVKKLIESIRDYNNQYSVNGKLKINKKQVERFTALVNKSYGTLTEILNG